MEQATYHPIAPSAKRLWQINGIIGTLFILAITIGVYFIAYKHLWLFALPCLYGIAKIGIFPAIEYRQWKYAIGTDRIEIIHGIFFVKRIILPINRIQHLKIRQGIIQKQFKLASIDLYTAGGSHGIEALSMEEADAIVLRLNQIVVGEHHERE